MIEQAGAGEDLHCSAIVQCEREACRFKYVAVFPMEACEPLECRECEHFSVRVVNYI